MVVSLDMTRMNKILEIDGENMTAVVQPGIYGGQLDEELKKEGYVCGHEPDSVEFSSLGGWISTKASGMKKNLYGNIEDIVINFTLVTSIGTFKYVESNYQRISQGPDLKFAVIGHEGNFGVITEAVIKIHKVPEIARPNSIVFGTFEIGMKFLREVARKGIWPASFRMIDGV